eukprot:1159079-Pelagomonas_calceolata.AAC.8
MPLCTPPQIQSFTACGTNRCSSGCASWTPPQILGLTACGTSRCSSGHASWTPPKNPQLGCLRSKKVQRGPSI